MKFLFLFLSLETATTNQKEAKQKKSDCTFLKNLPVEYRWIVLIIIIITRCYFR